MSKHSFPDSPLRPALPLRALLCALVIAFLAASPALAQTSLVLPANEALLVLPDSPGASVSSGAVDPGPATSSVSPGLDETLSTVRPYALFEAAFQNVPANSSPVAGPHDKYIKPNQQAPRLNVGDKVLLGIKDAASPLSAIGWLVSAGYSQLADGSPNYGTDGRAFAQRLGAAAARSSSEGIFSDSIMDSVLREDPRYYKMGSGHSFIKRAAYAATRTLITRTDGGHTTLNLAYLSGNLAGAALTQAYYPPVNRGFSQVAQTFGGSIGGGAIGFLASEFLDDIFHIGHHK